MAGQWHYEQDGRTFGPISGATLRERWSSKLPARPLDELEPLANTLTELHALGHVHGRVQSDAIFFDSNRRPCLDELASVHALCGCLTPDFPIP